jgi:hypothetical protein
MVRLPFQTLATPDGAIAYFRAALLLEDAAAPRHQYLCFSEALKREVESRGDTFSLGNYMLVRDRVRRIVEERAGPLEDVEIGEPVYFRSRPAYAEVPLRSASRRAVVQMILEPEYTLSWSDPSLGVTVGILAPSTPPPRIEGGRLVLEFPLAAPVPPGAGQPQRVTFERAWKILGLKDSDLEADLRRALRETAPEPSGRPAPPTLRGT